MQHEHFGLAQRQAQEQAGQSAQCTEQSHSPFVGQGFWVSRNAGKVDTERWPGCRMLGMVESLRKLAAWDDGYRMVILGIKPTHDE